MSGASTEPALSRGVIASHLRRGQAPPKDRAVFQVLATKKLSDPTKHRLGLTDGDQKYTEGLLVIPEGRRVPVRGDVVDLASRDNQMVLTGERNILVVKKFTVLRSSDGPGANGGGTEADTSAAEPRTPSTSTSRGSSSPQRPAKRSAAETSAVDDTRTPDSSASASAGPSSSSSNNGAASAKRALFGSTQRLEEDRRRRQQDDVLPQLLHATHQIKDLNPYQNKYTILARITELGQLAERNSSRWSGYVFNVTLQDASGDIRATAFGEQAEKFYPLLEEGKAYYVSHAQVKPIRDRKFNTTSHNYELTLNQNSVIKECLRNANLPKLSYGSFTPLKDIPSKPKGETVSVIGYCSRITDLFQGVNKFGKPYRKRDIFLVDEHDDEVKVTIWDDKAEKFDGDKKVIAVKGGKVDEWQGTVSVTLSFSGSFEVDPETDEARALKSAIEANSADGTPRLVRASSSISSFQNPSDQWSLGLIKLELRTASLSDSGRWFTVEAYFNEIKRDTMAYKACPNETCNRKVTDRSSGQYDCRSCGVSSAFRYKFNVKTSICDETENQWVTLFEDAGREVFGMSAHELMDLREHDASAFHRRIEAVQMEKYCFRLRYKLENYNDTLKPNVTVDRAEKVDRSSADYWRDIRRRIDLCYT